MTQVKLSPIARYGVPVLLVLLAAAVTWAIPTMGQRIPFALFYVPIIVAAFYGGIGPGLLTVALSLLLGTYLFIPPVHSFNIGWDGLVHVSTFFIISMAVTLIIERIRRAEGRAEVSREQLVTTLRSIGDAVISTDAKGLVRFMNGVAQQLTGWPFEDAEGKDLREVFQIINEDSRHEVESPVTKVLREGIIVGLANHTLLISKDGKEIPIGDSGAPIKDGEGRLTGVVLVFRDVTERRQAEEAKRRLAAIVESSEDAIFSKTLDGIITSWNKSAERLYGYSAEEIVGRSVSVLAPPDRSNEIPDILERLKRGERVEQLETKRVTKDGRVLDIALTISPIKDTRDRIIGASTIAHDITKRKRAEKEREELLVREKAARVEAEEANRTKDEFLATLSHELRTPLTAILGWVRLLRMKELDGATAEHALETVERNARAQAQLIEDLLDVSRVITGNLRLEMSTVELVPVIKAAMDAVEPAANAKMIKLEASLDPAAGPVSGDAARLQQVVWNLLSNAVKFTPREGRVSIRLERADSQVEIRVTDTGQGISADFLPFIFDRFRQADSSTTRQHGGLGLGLAIVRHLVELHGGTVHAESAGEGRGATIKVRLPILPLRIADFGLRNKELDEESAGPNPKSEILSGLRVLVVDDEPDARELMKAALESRGAAVITAGDTNEALETLKRRKPDVIISDIGMPGEDGYALIRHVRRLSEEQGGATPAAAVSAYVGEESRQEALAAGYELYVDKPLDPEELIAVVRKLAKDRRQEQ